MAQYITALQVSLNTVDVQSLRSQGFKEIDGNLNEGAGGNAIRLWYKYGSVGITEVQVSFNEGMVEGLINEGYKKINKDLNAGAGGSKVYLWYLQGPGKVHATPIVDMSVTTDVANEAQKFAFGWERVAWVLNRKATGISIHLWLKREKQTYICDVTATDSYGSDSDLFKQGYTRMDYDINRGAGGANVFIWYLQTTDPKKALKDLQVSINDHQCREYQQQDYQQVVVNLNEGPKCSNAPKVYMWYTKEVQGSNKPIKAIALLLNPALVPDYEKAGLTVIQSNLNTGTEGCTEYLCFYQ